MRNSKADLFKVAFAIFGNKVAHATLCVPIQSFTSIILVIDGKGGAVELCHVAALTTPTGNTKGTVVGQFDGRGDSRAKDVSGDLLVGEDAIGAQFRNAGLLSVKSAFECAQGMLPQGALVVGAEHASVVEEAKRATFEGRLAVAL